MVLGRSDCEDTWSIEVDLFEFGVGVCGLGFGVLGFGVWGLELGVECDEVYSVQETPRGVLANSI